MTKNPHFETAATWKAAEAMLTFRPIEPRHTAGHKLQSLQIHVRDHKQRELPAGDRTLEAHYGAFVFTQSRKGLKEAQRLVVAVSYGRVLSHARIGGHEARVYELGPEPPPGDIDGRMPAVVTWHDAEIFYLLASSEIPAEDLLRVAVSLYHGKGSLIEGIGR